MKKDYDFSGWATKNNLKCSDGVTIIKDAFKDNDGTVVPLVWNHQHNDPLDVLGHARLENRSEGVYAYGYFNDTEAGQTAKQLVLHGDVNALSIYANKLKKKNGNVLHGAIREVSLVLAGANPGAYIDSLSHSDDSDDSDALIFTGEQVFLHHSSEVDDQVGADSLNHADNKDADNKKEEDSVVEDKTVADVFNTLNEEQKTVVYAMIGAAIEETNKSDEDEDGGEEMKQNVFDQDERNNENVLSHAEMKAIVEDGKRYGSLKESMLQHGITDIEYLFPDAKNITATPTFIERDRGWVSRVMGGVHKSPFSRIKSIFADITEDDARAKGYIKGKLKKEEVFTLLKRTTTPTTVYKKQKLDRDDVVDIVDFDVISWMKTEMRWMLDEELARAVLVGDGRLSSSDDKINEGNIRPIWKDDDLYTIKANFSVAAGASSDVKAKAFIRTTIKSRKDYKGSGNPVLFTTEDVLTDCLLMEDSTGRIIYDSVDKLATALRVKEIITVPVMENLSRTVEDKTHNLMGIIVNLNDYNVGADKGGAVNLFDDFDIDYNAQKYLIETRCSGALTKPFSAIAIEFVEDGTEG